MKCSIRNVANLLLSFGVIALALATLSSTIATCSTGNCFTAAAIFGLPEAVGPIFEQSYKVAATTQAVGSISDGSTLSLAKLVSTVGVYVVSLAVLMLVALEIVELYYIRKLVGRIRLS